MASSIKRQQARDIQKRINQQTELRVAAQMKQRIGKYHFPVGALELAEALIKLDLILLLLETVNVDDIGESKTVEQRQFNKDMLRSTKLLIKTWHRFGNNKMKFKYLSNT